MSNLSFDEQADQLVRVAKALGSGTVAVQPKALKEILSLAKGIPVKFFPQDFPKVLSTVFNVSLAEMQEHFMLPHQGALTRDEFDALVPPTGWLHDYIEYTRGTESPTVYHFFAAVCVLGATISRRAYMARGSGNLYPNLNCVLVAPPGICRKTTACNIAVDLFRRIGGNVLADKMTAEALVESFKTSPSATGLLYAPEWAVMLGREEYLRSLTPVLTAWFDCPDTWSSMTIARGTPVLTNIGISHLAATTTDWIQTSITKDALSGGFFSRLLFVVQYGTPRKFPDPPALSATLATKLLDHLLAIQQTTGVVVKSPEAQKWWVDWYMNRKASSLEKQFAGYSERKPDRLLQLSMILNAAEDSKSLEVSVETIVRAEKILSWIEKLLPPLFAELSATTAGDDQGALLKQIRYKGGEVSHAEWVRMNRTRMSSDTFKKCVTTLMQGGQVTLDYVTKTYYLLPPGWSEE